MSKSSMFRLLYLQEFFFKIDKNKILLRVKEAIWVTFFLKIYDQISKNLKRSKLFVKFNREGGLCYTPPKIM
jgi:hypothetical protein